ncbi:Iron-containing redox enzyme [Nocardioides exalbidus]|uniref:Iron-containing redox enzyme n=1 Tax=Nocardioides exalbidus TaxID=402596 RepID=A0A1H4Y654_9ACTN|nr:iron-containing redox enzyme family protein [Nocardioides exalbidus]SED13359.1 Iron-containing redox enzyme [Nocardioides exalbidus]
MRMPKPRGPLSDWVAARLSESSDREIAPAAPAAGSWDDECLALWTLHELSYRGFEDAVDDAEEVVDVLVVRRALEVALEQRLRGRWSSTDDVEPAGVPAALQSMVADDDGPSLADHVRRHADVEEVLELLRQRSVYQLKEADPTTWAIPRLPTRAKAALVQLQYDEYGDGDPNRMHAHLFARGMLDVGLRPEYGAYLDDALPETLELNNALSMFGMVRRLRGAAVGHLAAFEMTSSLPARKMVQGLQRLELTGAMVGYFDEHVEADAIHEVLAAREICGSLAADEPALVGDILFGAFTCLDLEARFAGALLRQWGVEA